MSTEKLRTYAYLSVSVIGGILLGFFILRYLFIPVLPFLIAWGVAFMLRPPSIFLSNKLHLNRKFISVILAILTVSFGIGALLGLCAVGVRELWSFLSEFASGERLSEIISNITNPLGTLFGDKFAFSNHVADVVKNAISTLLSKLVDVLSVTVSAIPKALFFILVTVIASVYFSLDLEGINRFVKSHLSKRFGDNLVKSKNRFFSVGIKYIKSYLIIMVITFIIMLVGFFILRVEKALLIAAIVAFLDLLPVIGVGTLIVPWSVYQLICGNFYLGIGLLVLWLIHEIIRQFIEPKIIGKNLGIHPILSLVLLYVGYSVFGIVGLIFLPIIGSLVGVVLNKEDSSEVG